MRDQKTRQRDTDKHTDEAEGNPIADSVLQTVEPLASAPSGDTHPPDEAREGEDGSNHATPLFCELVGLVRRSRPYPVQLATSIASGIQSPKRA